MKKDNNPLYSYFLEELKKTNNENFIDPIMQIFDKLGLKSLNELDLIEENDFDEVKPIIIKRRVLEILNKNKNKNNNSKPVSKKKEINKNSEIYKFFLNMFKKDGIEETDIDDVVLKIEVNNGFTKVEHLKNLKKNDLIEMGIMKVNIRKLILQKLKEEKKIISDKKKYKKKIKRRSKKRRKKKKLKKKKN
jgi:hypothetical protein